MRNLLSLMLLLLFVGGCANSSHNDRSFYSYNLDVPDGRYSSINFEEIGDSGFVTVQAVFIERRGTPEWNPSASFQFFSEDGNGYAALVIPNRNGMAYQPFLVTKSRSPETKEVISGEPVYFEEKIYFNEEFTLLLAWHSKNSLLVQLNGGESKIIPLEFSVKRLSSSNSAGEIEVISLAVNKCNKSNHTDAKSCAGV